jgi:NADH:ubiquinone reductase (H+-translocating)
MTQKKQIVIIGAGFAGLFAARELSKDSTLEILLVDRNNFHTFTPLLYQVATCALDPATIAYPVRTIFRHHNNVHFLLGEVMQIDHAAKSVTIQSGDEIRQKPYDYLLIATGSITNYFGQPSVEAHSFPLKDLNDAVRLRHHILKLFEKAAWSDDAALKDALTTLVVVGGGATGLETAGALFELYNHVLKAEYDDHHPRLRARVILLEASDRVLAPYPPKLQQSAIRQLESLGVEVMLNASVAEVTPDRVILKDGRIIPTHTLVWSAGVKASPVAEMLEVELQRSGRLPVEPTMKVIGREGIYAAGDITWLEDPQGNPYAQVIQVARQQAVRAAKNILHDLRGESQEAFVYNDLGIMATIGRRRAVAWIFNRIQLSGFIAWLGWLFLHLIMLMGFRNRISVFINWVWNYLTYDRSVRIILDKSEAPEQPEPEPAPELEKVQA